MVDEPSAAPGGDDDLGEPIQDLRDYREAADPTLWGRVVRSVQRRSLASQLATLWWSAMGHAVVEFLEAVHSLFGSHDGDRGDPN